LLLVGYANCKYFVTLPISLDIANANFDEINLNIDKKVNSKSKKRVNQNLFIGMNACA